MKKLCPSHLPEPVELPIDEFGVNRAKKDGKDIYCKECRVRMVKASRRLEREMLQARQATPAQVERKRCEIARARPLGLRRSVWLVLDAIRNGATTRDAIRDALGPTPDAAAIGVREDLVANALAELLFVHVLIGTAKLNNGERVYFERRATDEHRSRQTG